jgi:hypothetical protein
LRRAAATFAPTVRSTAARRSVADSRLGSGASVTTSASLDGAIPTRRAARSRARPMRSAATVRERSVRPIQAGCRPDACLVALATTTAHRPAVA